MNLEDYTTDQLAEELKKRMGSRNLNGISAQRVTGISRITLHRLAAEDGMPHFNSCLTGMRYDPNEVKQWIRDNKPQLLGL